VVALAVGSAIFLGVITITQQSTTYNQQLPPNVEKGSR
jgi:hypothetical protein